MGCTASTPAAKQFDANPITSSNVDKLPIGNDKVLSDQTQGSNDTAASTKQPSTGSNPSIATGESPALNASHPTKIPQDVKSTPKVGFLDAPAKDGSNRPLVPQEEQPPMKRVAAADAARDNLIIPKISSVDPNLASRKVEDYFDVDRSKRIGKGHYASVFIGIDRSSGQRVAVKMIEKRLSKTERLALEVNVMKKAGEHPYIVQLIDVFETETQLQLVLELVEGGELFEHLVEHGPYSEATAAMHIRDVTRAISFLHAQNIIHRDLKPENILLTSKDDSARIKIADFGLAKLMIADVTRTVCGTWAYCAYEVKKPGGAYDSKCDVWSIGVIAYILLSAYHPFDPQGDATDDEIWQKISQADYNFEDPAWNTVSEQAKDFVSKLLVLDPKKRMSADEALQHPWLKNVPDSMADIESQPALSPAINDKLATFQNRSRTAMNPLQRAAAAMRNRVSSWKSSSTASGSGGTPSPSWARRNLAIAAAAAARAARGSGGGVNEEGSPTKNRSWSGGGSGRFKEGIANNGSASPSSSSQQQQNNLLEEKSETPPSSSVFFPDNQPFRSSPLKTEVAFVSQATGETLDVPSTPAMAGGGLDGLTEESDSPNSPASTQGFLAEVPTLPSPNQPILRVVVTGEEQDDATLRSSDLNTVSDEEEMEDVQEGDEEEYEEEEEDPNETFVSGKSDNITDGGAGAESFKTAREQSGANTIQDV